MSPLGGSTLYDRVTLHGRRLLIFSLIATNFGQYVQEDLVLVFTQPKTQRRRPKFWRKSPKVLHGARRVEDLPKFG